MSRNLATVCFTALLAAPSPGLAQSTNRSPNRDRRSTTQQQRRDGHDEFAAEPAEPYLLRPGHYVFPAPYSPDYWSPHIRPFPDYSHSRYGFDGRGSNRGVRQKGFSRYERGFYNRGYYDGYPGGHGYGYDAEAAYNQGRYDADHEYLWFIAATRAGRLLNQYAEKFDLGVIQFREGNYDRALVNLLGAAEKNQANAASRLHAGHALFALGRYSEAASLIARAFELSPGLPYKTYDIRDEYGKKADFEAHLARLKLFVARHPNEIGGVTMLGYVTFYTEGPGKSYKYLKRAYSLSPTDMFIPKLLNIARLTDNSDSSTYEEPQPSPQSGGTAPAVSPREGEPRYYPRRATSPVQRKSVPIRQVSARPLHN